MAVVTPAGAFRNAECHTLPRPTETQCGFQQDSQMIHILFRV